MMRSNMGCMGLILFGFAFLALMAWTGALIGIDGFKMGSLRWLVEDVIVANLGRSVGAITMAFAGIVLAAAVYAVGDRR